MSKPPQPAGSLAPPNLAFWGRREEWTPMEASLLLVNVEPRSEVGQRFKQAISLTGMDEAVDPIKHSWRGKTNYKDTSISQWESGAFILALDIHSNAWAAIRRRNLQSFNETVVPRAF